MKYFATVDDVEYEILFWGPVEGGPARAEARKPGRPPEDVRDWKLLERILERASWARRVEAPGTEAWRALWTDRVLEAMGEIATLREQLAKTEERLRDDDRRIGARVLRLEESIGDARFHRLVGSLEDLRFKIDGVDGKLGAWIEDHDKALESLRIRIGGLEAIVGRLVNHGGGAEGRAEPAK